LCESHAQASNIYVWQLTDINVFAHKIQSMLPTT
jgi:hypothetical protein